MGRLNGRAPVCIGTRLGYLVATVQLTDRTLARGILLADVAAHATEARANLQRALDLTQTHGFARQPCWCSLHQDPFKPLRVV